MSVSQSLSFLRVPQEVVENSITPFLGGEDCLALSLACKESSTVDGIWYSKAQKWKNKATTFLKWHMHITLSDATSRIAMLGSREICRLGVIAKALENFPLPILKELFGNGFDPMKTTEGYFKLPKIASPRMLPPEIQMQEEPAHSASDAEDETGLSLLFAERITNLTKALLPSQLIDSNEQSHHIMRYSTQGRLFIAFNICLKLIERQRYQVYSFSNIDNVADEYSEYDPARSSDQFILETDSVEIRSGTQRRFLYEGRSLALTSFHESAMHIILNAMPYKPFVPAQKKIRNEEKKE